MGLIARAAVRTGSAHAGSTNSFASLPPQVQSRNRQFSVSTEVAGVEAAWVRSRGGDANVDDGRAYRECAQATMEAMVHDGAQT